MKNLLLIFIVLFSLSACDKTIVCECKGVSGTVLSTNQTVIKFRLDGGSHDKGDDCWKYRSSGIPPQWFEDTVTCIIK